MVQQYLHDNTLALQNYRTYLALTPRPQLGAVNNLANSLEPSGPAAPVATAEDENQTPAPETRPSPPVPTIHPTASSRTQAVTRVNLNPPRQAAATTQVVKVQTEPTIVGTPVAETPSEPTTGKTGSEQIKSVELVSFHEPENNPPTAVAPAPPPVASNNRVGITPLPPVRSVSTAHTAAPRRSL